MALELRITSGARAGARERFDKSVVSLGRHPMNDLRLDVERDVDVSGRHAELRVTDGRVLLVDLGSTNGTYVNGQVIDGERAVFDGDLIALGKDGPRIELRLIASMESAAPEPTRVSGGTPAPAAAPRRDTTARIAEAVEKQTGTLRRSMYALAAVLVVGLVAAYVIGERRSAGEVAAMRTLLARTDSLNRALSAAAGRDGGMADAYKVLQAENGALAQQISAGIAKGGGSVEELSARLAAAERRLVQARTVGTLDAEAIAKLNLRAVALIAVEMANGDLESGTAFGVTPQGLLVTNRHVVQGADGQPPKRIAVIFSESNRWIAARLVKVSTSDDLAFIKLDGSGPFPSVVGIGSSARAVVVGSPVAIIGYPLGTSTAGMDGDISTITAHATLARGTIAKSLDDILQIDAFVASGSSGSPVFNAQGWVVGVVYGGPAEAQGRIVYSVPSDRLIRQLPTEGASAIKSP
ncbi:MAG: trypsin-like peptidase domain-containing protein [Gemmatimonadaceae bacterium]|nr:trypsin-like peptidase domain-containing protein [Gemmatimonadaceae bacterium]